MSTPDPEHINKLPEEFREVVILRGVKQLSYEEIVEITGLPMGIVRSRLARARAMLEWEARNDPKRDER